MPVISEDISKVVVDKEYTHLRGRISYNFITGEVDLCIGYVKSSNSGTWYESESYSGGLGGKFVENLRTFTVERQRLALELVSAISWCIEEKII